MGETLRDYAEKEESLLGEARNNNTKLSDFRSDNQATLKDLARSSEKTLREIAEEGTEKLSDFKDENVKLSDIPKLV